PRHVGLLWGEYYRHLPRSLQRAASALAQLLREPEDGGLGVHRVKRFLKFGEGSVTDRFIGYLSKVHDGDRRALYSPDLRRDISGMADGVLPEGFAHRGR